MDGQAKKHPLPSRKVAASFSGKPFLASPHFREIIPDMGLPFRVTLQAIFIVTVYFIPVFGQTGGGQIGAVSASLRAGEFDHALQLLHPMLQESPSNPQLWSLQALAYEGTKRNKDALESFQRALKVSPDYLAALEGAAQLEYEAGSGEAIPLLHRILVLRPSDPTSHAMLAVLEYHRGNCLAALQNFDMSGELANSQADALRARGSCLVRTKQLDKAIPVFQRLLGMNPSDTVVRCQLASVELMADRPKEAIGALTPALETSDPSVLQLASSAYEAMNDTPDAVRILRQAIVNNPRDVDLYVDFADLSMEHQSFQVGIDVIDSGLRIQPASAPLYVARGILYVQLAKFDEAEADFEKANSLDPKTSLGAVAQGLEAIENSDPDRALETVRAKLAKKPNDPYLLYLEADILTEKGVDRGTPDFAKALSSAQKAVSLQPSLTSARDVLAKLYLQAGQHKLAIAECRQALISDPKDQTALYHLIQALRKSGETAEIPQLLKRLAELRAESSKEESEHNRYKLVERSPGGTAELTQP
jgi:tetratricopeptide (TPR) repeat protein